MYNVIGHRGYSEKYPENTMISFAKAIEVGADGIELDVHMTSDNELIVHHMFYLGSSNNGKGILPYMPYAEIKPLDAGSWFDISFSNEHVPLLNQVFEKFGKSIQYEIELKGYTLDFLEKVIKMVGEYQLLDKIEFTSPHPYILSALKEKLPAAQIGMFAIPIPEWMDKKLGQDINLHNAIAGKFRSLHCPLSLLDDDFIQKMTKANIICHAADCNSDEDLKISKHLKVGQLSTNCVEKAIQIRDQS